MIENFEEKINIELLKFNNSGEISEIIIRGEESHKNKGIIIHYIDNKNVDYKKICEDIKNYKLQDVQNYLTKNGVIYNIVDFL